MANRGHDISHTLQKLALDVLLGEINRTAISTLLGDLADQTKLFADIFDEVCEDANGKSSVVTPVDPDRELEFNP